MDIASVMLGTWAVVGLIAVALVIYGIRQRRSAFWGLSRAAWFMAVVGFAGLSIGMARFPDSNLLGGYGLVFGPVWALAMPFLIVIVITWLVRRARQRD
jgi:hypothetical protein